MEKELKSHTEKLDRLTKVIDSKRKIIKAQKPVILKEKEESNKNSKELGEKESRKLREEESLKIKIADQNKQNQDIITQLEQKKREYNKMEKDLLNHKAECLELKDKEKLLQRETNNKKNKFKSILNSELKRLDKEKRKNVSDADKKRKIYYDSLMDSLNTLGKEEKFTQNQLKRQEKKIQTLMSQKDQLKNSIQTKKTRKAPQITIWNKQIKKFEKDLKQYNRIQQNLYILEYELRNWNQYIQDEKEKLDDKVNTLKDRIKYKKSDTYLQFLRQSAINFKSSEAAAKRMANSIARKNIRLDERELRTLEKEFDRIQKKYQNFIKSYKIRKKKISAEFRPFRGREQVIKNRIKNLKSKVADSEQIIHNLQEKLQNKNNQIDQSKSEYLKHQKEVQNKLKDIQLKIKRVLAEETNAQEEVNAKLEIRFAAVAEQKRNTQNNYEMGIQSINEILEYQDIMQKRIEHESLIQSGEIQLREFQDILHNLHIQQHGIEKSINHMEGTLEKTKNSIIRIKSQRAKKESQFNIQNEKLTDKFSDLEKELEQNLKEHSEIQIKNDKAGQELRMQVKAIIRIESDIVKLQKKVLTFTQKAQQLGFREKHDPIKIIKDYDQHRLLLIDMEDDFNQTLSMLDKNINDIKQSMALNRDREVDKNKSMNLISTEIKSMNNGLEDTLRLVAVEQDSMNEIGDQYLDILDKFIRLNNLCQKTKRKIDIHVDFLYDTIDKKSIEEKKKNSKLSKMQEKMKNQKVDISMLEKELASINQEIHDSLQDSIHFQKLAFKTSQTLPHYLDPELQSYMDIADMKSRSKSLFDEIVTIEHKIERMQKRQNTIRNKLTLSEKINLKKIRLMEETCSKLEAQILSERSELELLEETLDDFKKYKSVYGDRIEILEEELKEFREKETEYELLLKDLDRSLKDIQSRSKQIIDKKTNNTIENSIELDYMANLGLLLDPNTGLNILPESHNKDFRYFAVNRMLKSVLLMLFATFLFSAYSLRVITEPLNENLSEKLAVMADLNLKQDLKKKIDLNNKVADKIQNIINEDKALSNNMILAMKYLSNTVPKNFKVTELVLDRDITKYIDNIEKSSILGDTNTPAFIITMNGFYNQGLEKAESSMKSFSDILKRRNDFKTVIIGPGLVKNNWKTSFRILLAL